MDFPGFPFCLVENFNVVFPFPFYFTEYLIVKIKEIILVFEYNKKNDIFCCAGHLCGLPNMIISTIIRHRIYYHGTYVRWQLRLICARVECIR